MWRLLSGQAVEKFTAAARACARWLIGSLLPILALRTSDRIVWNEYRIITETVVPRGTFTIRPGDAFETFVARE